MAVETLRHARAQHDQRLAQLRREHDELAGAGPGRPCAPRSPTPRPRGAPPRPAAADADGSAHEAAAARETAAAAERAAAEREAAVNKAWRDASTRLEQLRLDATKTTTGRAATSSVGSGRPSGSLREGFGADPQELLVALTEEDSVETLGKQQELVQRRLALLGRVNLLATGEFEAVQERHDFMQRELDDVRKARRDLLEVDRAGRPRDHGGVHVGLPRRGGRSSSGSSPSCSPAARGGWS